MIKSAKLTFGKRPTLCRSIPGMRLLGLVFLLYGAPASASSEETRTYTEDEGRILLRAELAEFEQYIEFTMKTAREILQSRNVPKGDQKKLNDWQKVQQTRFLKALHQEDPLVALMDAWAVGQSLARYLEHPASSKELPETTRTVALDMLKRREDRLIHIAARYLPQDAVALLARRIDTFTQEQSIPKGEGLHPEAHRWTSPLFSVWAKGQKTAGEVLQLPLMPGRALQGVSESGKALAGIRQTAAEALQVANELPERIRKELELALDDLVAKRTEIIEVMESIDTTSTNLGNAAGEIQLMMAEINALANRPQNAQKGEASRPFDIREYGAAADSIQQGAAELRAVLHDLREMTEDEAFQRRLAMLGVEADASAQRAAHHARGVIDHLFWRLLQAAAVVFFLACLYPMIRSKLAHVGKDRTFPNSRES